MVLNRTMNSNQHGETTPLMQLLNGMVIHSAILMICKIFFKISTPYSGLQPFMRAPSDSLTWKTNLVIRIESKKELPTEKKYYAKQHLLYVNFPRGLTMVFYEINRKEK
jgi:hypothetical protein